MDHSPRTSRTIEMITLLAYSVALLAIGFAIGSSHEQSRRKARIAAVEQTLLTGHLRRILFRR